MVNEDNPLGHGNPQVICDDNYDRQKFWEKINEIDKFYSEKKISFAARNILYAFVAIEEFETYEELKRHLLNKK